MKITEIFGNRVLVRVVKDEAQTKFGLVLPDREDSSQKKGVVLMVAAGAEGKPLFIRPSVIGQTILFEAWGAPTMDLGDGEEYRMVEAEKVLAMVE